MCMLRYLNPLFSMIYFDFQQYELMIFCLELAPMGHIVWLVYERVSGSFEPVSVSRKYRNHAELFDVSAYKTNRLIA